MDISPVERAIRYAGGFDILATLAVIFYGIFSGLRRAPGRSVGRMSGLLRNWIIYPFASLVYFGFCYLVWKPFPFELAEGWRWLALISGSLMFFPGLAFMLWGRLALGRQYFISLTMGAQLHAGHRLITEGPFALIRHPMYFGFLMTGLGGILIYRTWTWVFIVINYFGLALRARREEQVLAVEFGAQWQSYSRRVPGMIPFMKRPRWYR
ncbi:MAG: methyltransferase family protein [Omnitrophica WOR_2 bacterium]